MLISRPSGQVTVEMILLSLVLLVVAQLTFNSIKTKRYLAPLNTFAYRATGNMIQNGNWIMDEEQSLADHPNNIERHYSWTVE